MSQAELDSAAQGTALAPAMSTLLATDGSDHALKAARFVARLLPAGAQSDEPRITLDVPELPPHLPWMIQMNRIEHDYIALFGFFYGGQPYRGSDRAYWIEYPAVTKVALAVRRRLTSRVTGFVRAENVGNSQRTEAYNLNLPTPRSLLVGANLSY